jgi:hypothetical protein
MYAQSLNGQLVQAHVEELGRAVQACNRGRGLNRPPASPRLTFIKRAMRPRS